MGETNGIMIPCWDGTEGDYVKNLSEQLVEKIRRALNVSGVIVLGYYKPYDKNGQHQSNYVLGIPELLFSETSNHNIFECIDRATSKFKRRHLKSVS